jgi:hypothetical protein
MWPRRVALLALLAAALAFMAFLAAVLAAGDAHRRASRRAQDALLGRQYRSTHSVPAREATCVREKA